MWQIVIFMFVVSGHDALVITHNKGKVLDFTTRQSCREHVAENLHSLMAHASNKFDGAAVREIECHLKGQYIRPFSI